jgi:hypothetical protein
MIPNIRSNAGIWGTRIEIRFSRFHIIIEIRVFVNWGGWGREWGTIRTHACMHACVNAPVFPRSSQKKKTRARTNQKRVIFLQDTISGNIQVFVYNMGILSRNQLIN